MWDKLEQIDKRYEEIIAEMGKPETASDRQKITKLAQEKSAIDDIVVLYRDYKATAKSLAETRAMQTESQDAEMASARQAGNPHAGRKAGATRRGTEDGPTA